MTQEAAITRINPAMAFQKPLEDYINYLEKMTPRSVRLIEKLAMPWMQYQDPLHDVRGTDDIIRIFEQRLDGVQNAKWRVNDHAWGREGQMVYLRWTFTGSRAEGEFNINGVAEVLFSNDGLVMSHKDFVDTAYHPPKPLTLWGRIKKRYSTRLGA